MAGEGFDAEACAAELCRIFVGWRLQEDYDALAALGEGALRIDVLAGEAWCDGDPLPPLFIAGELGRALAAALERAGLPAGFVRRAELHAEFAAQPAPGRDGAPALRVACRAALETPDGRFAAEARRG